MYNILLLLVYVCFPGGLLLSMFDCVKCWCLCVFRTFGVFPGWIMSAGYLFFTSLYHKIWGVGVSVSMGVLVCVCVCVIGGVRVFQSFKYYDNNTNIMKTRKGMKERIIA